MPGNGYSGRANNLEVLTDPYGGYDVPGPYGVVICGMSRPMCCAIGLLVRRHSAVACCR